MCVDFKVFRGHTTGDKIFSDIQAVLQKFIGEYNSLFRIQLVLQIQLET